MRNAAAKLSTNGFGILEDRNPRKLAKKPQTKKPGKPATRRKQAWHTLVRWEVWLKRAAIVVLVLVFLPIALTVVYRIPAVHPVSTLMAKDLVTLQGYDRRWVDLDEIAPVLVHSVMMSEDGQFCAHNGVDWGALNEVIDNALEGEKTRGASTITMQSAKNLFLWSSRSYVRKGLEIPLAWYMNVVLPKRRVMEIYLNIAEWGPGIYGVEAAAQHHFGRSAAKLSRRQSALLAVTLPSPLKRNPAKPTRGLNRLAATIEKRARQAGAYIDCLKT